MATGLTLTVALMATLSARFASPDELERLRAAGLLRQPGQNAVVNENEDSEEESSEWEEADEEEMEDMQAPPDGHIAQGGPAAGGGGGEPQGVVAGAVQAAADALLAAGGIGGGVGAHGGVQLNAEFVDQGIQDLLNPEGEDKLLEADANGGMTGIPAQVQVVAALNSAASWGFMAGAAPIGVVGAWFWARQLKWAVMGAWALARYAFS
jgi:hypothetical protein